MVLLMQIDFAKLPATFTAPGLTEEEFRALVRGLSGLHAGVPGRWHGYHSAP